MTTLEDLDRRVTALEKAQKETAETQQWVASTLGRIAAVQDAHTKDIGELRADVRRVERKVDDLAASMPNIVASAMRDVLKER